jgi:hypothetical protein
MLSYPHFKMAIKSGINASKVEYLNNINFRMWKMKLSYVLTHEKLLYTLNSVKLELDDENDADIIKKQEKKNLKMILWQELPLFII